MLFDKDELIKEVHNSLIENNLPTSIYEENIKTLDFKDLNLFDKSMIHDIEVLNGAYIPATNTIAYNPNNTHLLRTLRHELVHVASTKRPKFLCDINDIEVQFFNSFPFIPNSGVSAVTYGNKYFGTSINEGITEFTRQFLVPEENEEFLLHLSYSRMHQFVGFLMLLIGPDKLCSIYLDNDCMTFQKDNMKMTFTKINENE